MSIEDDIVATANAAAYELSKHCDPPTTLEQALAVVRREVPDDVFAARVAYVLYMAFGVASDVRPDHAPSLHYVSTAKRDDRDYDPDFVWLVLATEAELKRLMEMRPATGHWPAAINSFDTLLEVLQDYDEDFDEPENAA